MKPKIAITGASGFVGSSLAQYLSNAGYEVTAILRKTSQKSSLANFDGKIVTGDFSSSSFLKNSLAGIDVVIHTAALVTDYAPSSDVRKANVDLLTSIVDAAKLNKCKQLIHFSTADVFGVRKNQNIGDAFDYKKTGFPYVDSKIDAEKYLFGEKDKMDLRFTIFRPSWIFGPGDKTFMPELVHALKTKSWFYIENRDHKVSVVFIDNLVKAIERSILNPIAYGQAYTLSDCNVTWHDLMASIASNLNLSTPTMTLPKPVAKALAVVTVGAWKILGKTSRPPITPYVVDMCGSNMTYNQNKLEHDFHWQSPTKFPEALTQTLSSFKFDSNAVLKTK